MWILHNHPLRLIIITRIWTGLAIVFGVVLVCLFNFNYVQVNRCCQCSARVRSSLGHRAFFLIIRILCSLGPQWRIIIVSIIIEHRNPMESTRVRLSSAGQIEKPNNEQPRHCALNMENNQLANLCPVCSLTCPLHCCDYGLIVIWVLFLKLHHCVPIGSDCSEWPSALLVAIEPGGHWTIIGLTRQLWFPFSIDASRIRGREGKGLSNLAMPIISFLFCTFSIWFHGLGIDLLAGWLVRLRMNTKVLLFGVLLASN